MIDAQLAYAFSLGLVAAINPCGFALLPAYLAYYLGLDAEDTGAGRGDAVLRAVVVSVSMSAGFLLVFGIMGMLWGAVSSVVGNHLPWVTFGLGVAVTVLGVAMLFGYEPVVNLPKLNFDKGTQQAWSMFLFGVSYAVASLSCTIPLFGALLTTTLRDANVPSAMATFLVYGLGMAVVVTSLTLAVALAKGGVVRWMRGMTRHMGRISGALMVLAGLVVAYFGWAEARQLDGARSGTGLADWMQEAQGSITNWVVRTGAVRIGLVLGVVVATTVGLAVALRRPPAPGPR